MFNLNNLKGKWNVIESTDEGYLNHGNRRPTYRLEIRKWSFSFRLNKGKKRVRRFSKKFKYHSGIIYFKKRFGLGINGKFYLLSFNEDQQWMIIVRKDSIFRNTHIDVLSKNYELSSDEIFSIRKKISSVEKISGLLKHLKNANCG